MADIRRVKLEGVAELKQSLDALGVVVATKIGAKADRDAALVLREALIETAPYRVGPTLRKVKRKDGTVRESDYGHLRDNIRVRKLKARKAHHIVYAVTIGNAFWGSFLEFGTAKMAARPWMRPTFDRLGNRLLAAQITALNAGIEAQARRLGRLARRLKK